MKRLVYELLDHYRLDNFNNVTFYRINYKNRIVRYSQNYVLRLLRKKSRKQLSFNQFVFLMSSVILEGNKYKYTIFKHIVNNINAYLEKIRISLKTVEIDEISQLKKSDINLYQYSNEIMKLDYEFENTSDINRIRELVLLRQQKRLDFNKMVSISLHKENIKLFSGKASYTCIKINAISIKNDGEIYKLSLFLFTEIYAFSIEGFTKTLVNRLRSFIDLFITKVSAYKALLKEIKVEYIVLRTKLKRI